MVGKLRLQAADGYQVLWAAHRVAQMLVDHELGAPGAAAVGSEQRAVEGWDDVVEQRADGSFVHHQVKRQVEDFDDRPANKAEVKPPKSKNNAPSPAAWSPEPSTLDTLFSQLARWVKRARAEALPERRFELVVLNPNAQIKDDLTVAHLQQAATWCRALGATAALLDARRMPAENTAPDAKGDGPTIRLYDWLTTWCGFADSEEIVFALSRLTVQAPGFEADLERRTGELLRSCYRSAEEARQVIRHHLLDNASPYAAETPDILGPALAHLLTTPRWTEFRRRGDAWQSAGTHAAGKTGTAREEAVVAELWRPEPGELRVAAPPPRPGEPGLVEHLSRLALHLPRTARARLHTMGGWIAWIEAAVGGTLGLAEDAEVVPEGWQDYGDEPLGATPHPLTRPARSAIHPLCDEMDTQTWGLVCQAVEQRRSKMSDEWREATEDTWEHWRSTLGARGAARHRFLCGLMRPAAEGERVNAALRVGRRTAPLIAEALVLLLMVHAVLGETRRPSPDTLTFAGQALRVGALAPRRWSGPAGKAGEPRRLDDAEGIDALLAGERVRVLVLSGVEGAVPEEGFMSGPQSRDRLDEPTRPELIVTASTRVDAARRGVPDDLRRALQERLEALEANLTFHQQGSSA